MPFDINPSGSIDITPLVSYESVIVADEWCAFRLVLARREDQLGTGSLIVQTSMTVEQTEGLVEDLQRMVAHIRRAKAASTPH